MLKGRQEKGGERRGDTFPGLKVVECGSRMGAEVSEGDLEMTFEMKAMARTSRSLYVISEWGNLQSIKTREVISLVKKVKKDDSRERI